MLAACEGKKLNSLSHFCKFLVNPKFDLETNCIFRKPTNIRFQWYIVYSEILWTFHARVEYIFVLKIQHSNQWGRNPPPWKHPVSIRGCGPHVIHPSFNWPHSPPQTASRSNQPFCHNTLSGHTDRPTDRTTDGLGDNSVPTPAYAQLIV